MLQIDLTGRVVLVTGGTRGVGRGVSEAFLDAGATVVTCSRSEVAEADLPATDAGRVSSHHPCDVRDPEAVARLVDEVVAAHGRLDVLVNNAGGAPHALAADASPRFHARITDLNLLAPLALMQAANRVMQRHGGGAIVNVSSGGASAAHRGMVAYDASKGGVEAMTRALALDLGPYGIRVNALAPGSVDVRGFSPEEAAKRGETIPLGRVGTPEDMAGVAVFLASDDARYVTGVAISVDGGLIAQQRSPQVDQFPPSRFPRL